MQGAFAVDAEQTILITNNEEYGYLASAYVAILNKAAHRWRWPAWTSRWT